MAARFCISQSISCSACALAEPVVSASCSGKSLEMYCDMQKRAPMGGFFFANMKKESY